MVTWAPPCETTSAAISPAGPAPMTATPVCISSVTITRVVQSRTLGWAKRSEPTKTYRHTRLWFWQWAGAKRAFAPFEGCRLQLHPGPGRRLFNVFLGLLEGAFQRLRLRHVADLSEVRCDGIRRPVGLGKANTSAFEDFDHRERSGPGAHDGAGRRILAEQEQHRGGDRFRLHQRQHLWGNQSFGHAGGCGR